MAISDRAKKLQAKLESTNVNYTPGRKKTGANRNAYIDWQAPASVGSRGAGVSDEEGRGDGFRFQELPVGGRLDDGTGNAGIYGGKTKEPFYKKIKTDLVKKTKLIKKEKIVKRSVVKRTIEPRDYVATITQVIDSNKIRVSLSYNDGVNKVKHKGADQSAETFNFWKVNYDKSNVKRYKTYMVKDNNYYLLVNDGLGADGESRRFRFKQSLQNNVNTLDKVHFVEKRLPDYTDVVKLVPFVDRPDDGIFLRIPNLNSVDNPINFEGTNFQSHDDLLGSNNSINFELEEKLISGSLLNVQPNIDYQKTTTDLNLEPDDLGFGNFVHFSSAERRLNNFKKKLELIENHNSNSASLLSISSSNDRVLSIERKRQRVINSFDPFEHYMYFESSSYVSSSLGQFHDTSWPKTTSSKPYTLSSVANASSWYNNIVASASSYDQRNMNSLRNSLPEHVNQDSSNNVFLEFMDMVGQQFDEIWTYTKSITDVNKRVEKLSEGISKDVAKHYAKALGLDLYSGNDLLNLPEYLLGKNADGSSKYEEPQEQITEEIWKRILANLPFFIKSKGTERAIKGLLSCYGIPSSILRVREYGGPENGKRVSYEIKRKFTRALDFKSGQYIKSVWKAAADGLTPDTIELRFRTPKSQDQVIFQKDNDFAIALKDNGATDNLGYLTFKLSSSLYSPTISSSLLPFYNDDMWSVMLTRKDTSGNELTHDKILSQSVYEITTKQYDSTRQKILYQSSQSLQSHTASLASDINNITGSKLNASFTGSGHVYLGGLNTGFGARFTGSLMEYRVWSEPLSASVFDNHTRTPKAYNGNNYSSSYDELLVRYELNDNLNLSTFTMVSSSAHDTTYEKNSVAVNGFTGNFSRTIVDQEQLRVPNVGPSRRNATKIRIEDNGLKAGTALSPEARNEQSSQDFAPLDSNRLGVYFSPTDVVNEDIVYSIADLNFDDFIGDPRDEFEYSYRRLKEVQTEYFKRYNNTNNFFDYLRILGFYDSSVFTQTRQLLPARANATLGVLVEPNILERRKEVIGKKPSFTNRFFENAGDFDNGVLITRVISGSDDTNFFTKDSSYDTYEGSSNLAYFTGSSIGFLAQPSLTRVFGTTDAHFGFGSTYLNAEIGVATDAFTNPRVPVISGSRLSEKNEEEEFFFSSALNASLARRAPSAKFYANSSSFKKSEFESVADSNNLFRSFYQGTQATRDNSIDGKDPIEVILTAPTTLVTQQGDDAKLRVK